VRLKGESGDHRSDLFSVGVILYEMIAGRQPFKEDHEAALIYAILNEVPEPLRRYKAKVPDGLQAIIDKALEKDADKRYQTAAGFLSDLKRLATTDQKSTVGKREPQKTRLRRIILSASEFLYGY